MSCILEVADLLVATPETFSAVEPTLIPLVIFMLTCSVICAPATCARAEGSGLISSQITRSLDSNNFESHEDGIQVLKYLLHYSPVISPAAWGMFPVLVQACVPSNLSYSFLSKRVSTYRCFCYSDTLRTPWTTSQT